MRPGVAADSATRRPSMRLMRADLPTFGKPTTHALTALGRRPLAFRLAFTASAACWAALATCMLSNAACEYIIIYIFEQH